MEKYVYIVIDKKGNKHQNTIEANSIDEARQLIKLTGKNAIKIEKATLLNGGFSVPKKVTQKDLAVFCQQMKSMLTAGVTVVDALTMVGSSTGNETLKTAINGVAVKVGSGQSLSEAFKSYDTVFPFLLIKMSEAGEASGSIERIFDRLGIQFEKNAKIANAIKKATSYPKLLILICIAVFIAMCAFVIPGFATMFEEMGTELPIVTKALMAFSDSLKKYWYIYLIVTISLVAGFKIYSASEKGKEQIDRIKLKLPVVKNLEMFTSTANSARLLSTLLSSGMYMPEAIAIVSNTMTNSVYKKAMDEIRTDVLNGISLYDAIDASNIFPELFLNLVNIGEQTGDITLMLDKAAAYFEDEVDTTTEQLTSMLQPMIILLLAGIIGLMVYSIYGPMLSIYDGMGDL